MADVASEGPLPSVWEIFRLRGDPFFTAPLGPKESSPYPISLFRGRDNERNQLKKAIGSSGRSATLLFAAGGFGKSTLSNRLVADLAGSDLLIVPDEIQLTREAPAAQFFREVVAGILRALVLDGETLPTAPSEPEKDAKAKLPALLEARQLVQLTRRLSGVDGGATIGPVGGQAGVQHEFFSPKYEPGTSKRLLDDVSVEVRSLGYSGILIRLNNLDFLAVHDKPALESFLGEIRDLLQVHGIHYILMGNEEVHSIIDGTPRVRGCFDLPIPVKPFSLEEVNAILEARYHHFASERGFVPPASPGLVAHLHEIYYGDLRNILADLKRCVLGVEIIEPKPLEKSVVLPVLEDLYLKSLDNKLDPADWEVLSIAAKISKPFSKAELGAQRANSEGSIQKLIDVGAIELSHHKGTSDYYRLCGSGWLGLRGLAGRT